MMENSCITEILHKLKHVYVYISSISEKDHNVTPPSVKIFPPSKNEHPRNKDDLKYKTLVCVATGFYPDHVAVSWDVSGEPRKDRISTDSAAQRTGKNYTISSRLQVPEEEWTNPKNSFNCTVSFYNGKTWEKYSAEHWGIEGKCIRNIKEHL